MRSHRGLTDPVNVDQLARELAARLGVDRVPVLSEHDEETGLPTLVAVDDVAQEDLDACVDAHSPVWPEPPPDPIDVAFDGIRSAATIKGLRAALEPLRPILHELNRRR